MQFARFGAKSQGETGVGSSSYARGLVSEQPLNASVTKSNTAGKSEGSASGERKAGTAATKIEPHCHHL